MLYSNSSDWSSAAHKRVALFGMSGLGKTHVAAMLRQTGDWFHYSVDFRIGTRYMGEHIVDNFKREAMRNPFLRELLMSDSIYIASNITFQNLAPLSTYLGKPGDPDKGGIAFEEYVRRQRQHLLAEVEATRDAVLFATKAREIYGYRNFVADTSGSLCEVVEADDPADPVLSTLARDILPVWIRGTADDTASLIARFSKAPKPMYYREDFLREIWGEFLKERGLTEARVDPDEFIRWGFARLVDQRLPRYAAIAKNWGITIEAADVSKLRDAQDFEALIAQTLAKRQ